MKRFLKFTTVALGVVVAVTIVSSCTQKSCPTYGKDNSLYQNGRTNK